jgi:hypothetical protein
MAGGIVRVRPDQVTILNGAAKMEIDLQGAGPGSSKPRLAMKMPSRRFTHCETTQYAATNRGSGCDPNRNASE